MIVHKGVQERGHNYSILFQMANVGVDVQRAIEWRWRANVEQSRCAFERALELLTFTIMDPKNKKRLRELCYTRDQRLDFFMGDNHYTTSDEIWSEYFHQFGYASAIERGH